MFIPRGRAVALIVLALSSSAFVGLPPADALTAPVPRQPPELRTYQFTARVKNNGGVSPFKVGEKIAGTFTYDLKARSTRPANQLHGAYQSARNSLTFQMGELAFTGTGDVLVTVSAFEHAEHFQVVAPDLKLPKGWEMDHTQRSQSYGVLLQNAPARKVIAGAGIPDRLSLSDFASTRELRLDFFHGVRFPGGQVKDRATVFADVESLKAVSR